MAKQKKNGNQNPPKFHESYTRAENASINDFITRSSVDDLAMVLDTVCTELLASSDKNFPHYYSKQLRLLELKIKTTDEIKYLKKYIKYLEKLIEIKTFDTLRPAFLEAYNDYRKSTGLSRVCVEQTFIDRIASEQIQDLRKKDLGTNKYTEYLDKKFGTNYVSHSTFLQILRKHKVTKYPVIPSYNDPHLDNAEILKTLGAKPLRYLLIKMIALLDNEDISIAYPIWLFTVASFCYSSSHHKSFKTDTYDGKSIHDLIYLKNKLEKERIELEALLEKL